MDNKFKSISTILREMSANRNSDLRKKVVNVARPDDADPTSEKSKLAKQAEIKTKIIDEEKIDEVMTDVGPNQGPLDEITVGDTVHAGFGKKGGAGFKGKVHKVDGDDIHINIGKGKYGDRIVKAPKRLVTKEEVEQVDESYDKNSKAHVTAKKISKGWKSPVSKPEYHSDGSASIQTKSSGEISSTNVVDKHLKNAGGVHNNSEKDLANHHQKIGSLNFHVKKTSSGHVLHIKEEVELDENTGGLFKNSSEWEKSAKARGLIVKSATHPSGEMTKYQIAKDKEGNNRGHFDHGTKSGRLKEEVVVEASVSAINKDDIEANRKDVDAPETKDKKEKKSDKETVDAKEVKGGKTEVELNPRTNDNNVDQDQEDGESKKARKAANKEIGAKGMKEETTMLKSDKTFGLPQGLLDSVKKVLDEKSLAALAPPHDKVTKKDVLVGRGVLKKHPSDPSKHVVAKEETEQLDEKIMASDYEATSEKTKNGHRPKVVHKTRGTTMYLGSTSYKTPEHAKGHAAAYLSGYAERGDNHATNKGIEYQKKNAQHIAEEVEQIDELSIQTMKSAKDKLADKAVGAHYDDNKAAARNYAARALKIGSKIKRKEWQEKYGKKSTNEEVELTAEELAKIEAIVKDME